MAVLAVMALDGPARRSLQLAGERPAGAEAGAAAVSTRGAVFEAISGTVRSCLLPATAVRIACLIETPARCGFSAQPFCGAREGWIQTEPMGRRAPARYFRRRIGFPMKAKRYGAEGVEQKGLTSLRRGALSAR